MYDKFTEQMQGALGAYKSGRPVVVLGKDETAIHGRDELQAIIDLKMPMECFTIHGIDVDAWNASDWPEILEAARQVYLLGRK